MPEDSKTTKTEQQIRTEKIANAQEKLGAVEVPGQAPKAISEQEKILELETQIKTLKKENNNIKNISALEKAGCIKASLVAKAVPEDCKNIDEWIKVFKSENEILFSQPTQNHGGGFKPTHSNNLSPVEQMNNFIRGLG